MGWLHRVRRRPRAAPVAAAALVVFGAAAAGVALFLARPVPAHLLAPERGLGITIEDRNGVPMRSTRAVDGSQARWVSYDLIDADLIAAFVAVEDRRFWEHHGIDGRAVLRALRDDVRERRIVSGASTITMQLARLLQPAGRTWSGKLAQALWALRLERHLTKQQILEQYLNRVQLGQATAGVGAGALLYFDASASAVSLGQAATLAGLAHAPSRDNPYVSPARARARRGHALRRIAALRYASVDAVARAREEPLVVAPRTPPFLAPHFTSRVLAWAGADTAPMSGPVRTTLDLELQAALEAEVQHTVAVLRERGVEQAAAVVLDNATGEVRAWVGSPDFWSARDGQTDMVISPRQPGSALKPFLYGLALERGVTAATVLPDIPRAYATATGAYTPRNYDRRFRGPVRAREALASSYNVPAVELAARVGTGSLLNTLRLAGFESLRRDAEYYGLGLALGNGDVTLLELANGYRALANGGEWSPWRWRPADRADSRRAAPPTRRVLSPVASAIVLDILSDAGARIPGFGVATPFDFPFPVAVKTGTSRHFTDNWAVGTTRGFTVAVWAGNFSGRPMQGVSGVTGAGPLLARAVMATARRIEPGVPVTPAEAGAVAAPVCRLSGLRATSRCAQLTEWFVPGTEPARSDDWERGDGRVALPAEYAVWARQSALRTVEAPPSAGAPAGASFRIAAPLDGDRYAIPAGMEGRYATIALRAGGAGASTARWSVDGTPVAGERWALREGAHVVRAVAASGAADEVRITVVR